MSIFAILEDLMPRKSSVPIEVTTEERQELWNLRRRSPKKRNWIRADIILRVAEGQTNYLIAKQLGLSRNTVQHWRYRFARERLAGLKTRPIPGRPTRVAMRLQAAELKFCAANSQGGAA